MITDEATRRAQLRQNMRSQRKALNPQQRMSAAQGLRRVLDTVPAFQKSRNIGGYWACRGEVPLNLALAGMQQRGQQYCLPRVQPQRQLQFAQWSNGDAVVANRFGIPEPDADAEIISVRDLDLVLVPLLAFDDVGNRLGTGGGYYDTSLAFLRASPRPTKPILIGIGYAFQQVEHLDAQEWDIPLDMIATEQQLIDCTNKRSAE